MDYDSEYEEYDEIDHVMDDIIRRYSTYTMHDNVSTSSFTNNIDTCIYTMQNKYDNNKEYDRINTMYSIGLSIVVSKYINPDIDMRDKIDRYVSNNITSNIPDIIENEKQTMIRQINTGIIDGKKSEYIDTFMNRIKDNKIKTDNVVVNCLSELDREYTNDALSEHLTMMYEIGVRMSFKEFDKEKMESKLNDIIEQFSQDNIDDIRLRKRSQLLAELRRAISDSKDSTIMKAYDEKGEYMYYDTDRLKRRAIIDAIKYKHNIY
jgi:hypothetical protein